MMDDRHTKKQTRGTVAPIALCEDVRANGMPLIVASFYEQRDAKGS